MTSQAMFDRLSVSEALALGVYVRVQLMSMLSDGVMTRMPLGMEVPISFGVDPESSYMSYDHVGMSYCAWGPQA